ncbi:Sensor histidine kinase YpdA [Streptococcus parauberis]|nr:Sensor histidine kinase YpdA [Streptococcus parauberis]
MAMNYKKLYQPFSRHFHQGILINRLMKVYSLLIFLFFGIGALSLSAYSITADLKTVEKESNRRLEEAVRTIETENYVTLRVLEQLAGRSDDYSNLNNYMTMNQSDYFNQVFADWQAGKNTLSFSDQVRRLFDLYPEMQNIVISLDDSNSYFTANRVRKGGQIKTGKLNFLKGNYLVRSLRHPDNGEIKGRIYLTFDTPSKFFNGEEDTKIATIATDDYGRLLFKTHRAQQSQQLSNIIKSQKGLNEKSLGSHYQLKYQRVGDWFAIVTVNKLSLIGHGISIILIYSLIAGLLAWLLLKLLFGLFRNYIEQVSEITDTLDLVAAGDLSLKIDNSHMELELYNISQGINLMLDNINQSIEEIYALEVDQRDAHMSALQAQINPHFLYNTLEYVRMYALSCRQEELADVIYAFAALLRNNISKDKVTTLKEELDFCEKYIYLYQMRYPDSFAYHVTIDPSISAIQIPKFILQPLVENYFVHGIDYSRFDNALSIKVKDQCDFVRIEIEDNGKGISPSAIKQLNQDLAGMGTKSKSSIGLENVYLRLMTYFKDNLSWTMSQSRLGGFKIEIIFRKED